MKPGRTDAPTLFVNEARLLTLVLQGKKLRPGTSSLEVGGVLVWALMSAKLQLIRPFRV